MTLAFVLLFHVTVAVNSEPLLKAIYWEVKPFIFENEYGVLDGIIPKMFETGKKYCMRNTSDDLISFSVKMSSRETFINLLHSNISYEEGALHDIKANEAVWFPVLSDTSVETDIAKHLHKFQLMLLSGIAVIVPRYLISLPYKIFRGILGCQQIFIIAVLLSALFGIVIWMIERFNNKEFSSSFIKGTGTGIWWSVVSMTTVGYGDVVPRSILGRLVALCWLLIGLLLGCLMTATVTDVVAGLNGLSVRGRFVSVLEKSFESKVAARDFDAKVIPTKSYLETLKLVREGKVFAAMVSADVAAWYQQEIEDDSSGMPLRVIQNLPANLFVNSFFAHNVTEAVKNATKCMYFQRDEVYTQPILLYQRFCYTEKLFIGPVMDLFRESLFIQVLLAILCIIIVLGLSFEFINVFFCQHPQQKKRTETECTTVLI